VRRDRDVQLSGHLERGLLGEARVAGDVEGDLDAHPVVGVVAQPLQERADGGVGGPLPRTGLDVAVREHEPSGHRTERVERGFAVVDGLQVVRPVDRRGDARVERLDGCQPVAGGDVLRPELLPVLEVVPDEVLGQRPVGAVTAHGGLPHVPVRVDHPRHHDAATGVDLLRALRHVELRTDRLDAVVDDQDVGVGQDRRGRIHRQDGAAAQHQGATGYRNLLGMGHRLLLDVVVSERTVVRRTVSRAMADTLAAVAESCQEPVACRLSTAASTVDTAPPPRKDCAHRMRGRVSAA
jgi:hypothetical protein